MTLTDFFEKRELLDDEGTHQNHWSGPRTTPVRIAYRERLTCWILRVLLGENDMPAYQDTGNPRLAPVAELLNAPSLANPAVGATEIQNQLAAARNQAFGLLWDQPGPVSALVAVIDCSLAQAVDWLAQRAGLDPVERAIL